MKKVTQEFIAAQAKQFQNEQAMARYESWTRHQQRPFQDEDVDVSPQAYVAWMEGQIALLVEAKDMNVGLYCNDLLRFQLALFAKDGKVVTVSS